MQTITSPEQVQATLGSTSNPVVIGFFGDFSAASRQAQPAFEQFCASNTDLHALYVDVGSIKGVHKQFDVSTVPTVVVVKNGAVIRKVIGPQSPEYYDRALVPHDHVAKASGEAPEKVHRVVVYTGSHCVWCKRLTSYLKQQRVRFREIDVSKNPSEAQSLQAKTGQTGVPQSNIDGHWIVGFDKPRINTLLGLAGNG